MRMRVTIVTEYECDPEHYRNGLTPQEVAKYDEELFSTDVASVEDILQWSADGIYSVSIVPIEEKASET
jgi:hypothetical protein